MKNIKPYSNNNNKKKQIKNMFDNISQTYDLLNTVLSFRMDYFWRKSVVKNLNNNPKTILDIATGTADIAISASKIKNAKITGVDISPKMLEIGNQKIKKRNLTERITLELADAESLPYESNSFQAITAGFGVRNFENMKEGLKEMYRVLEINGTIIILEPSTPSIFPFKQIYKLYFSYLLPFVGKLVSKDESAYQYFTQSVKAFPEKNKFIDILKKIGFKNCKQKTLTFGVASLYIAEK